MVQTMAQPDILSETPMQSDDACWEAVMRRDRGADGRFFTCVKTTGIYCRPSCGAKRPKRENVFFVATRAEAEAAGFRACKRCRPEEAVRADGRAEMIAKACRMIEAAEEPPSLDALAEAVGLSPFHFHRLFKQAMGVSPKGYADAVRARRLRENLPQSDSVTGALYEAGFGSASRFYARFAEACGRPPAAYRRFYRALGHDG